MEKSIEEKLDFLSENVMGINKVLAEIAYEIHILNKKTDVQMDIITSSNQMLSEQIEIANMEVVVLRKAMEASILDVQEKIQKVDDKIPK